MKFNTNVIPNTFIINLTESDGKYPDDVQLC